MIKKKVLKGNVMSIELDVSNDSDIQKLIRKIKKDAPNYKIMIVVDCDVREFYYKLGESIAKSKQYDYKYAEAMLQGGESGMYAVMGAMMLDYYIPDDYFVLAGGKLNKIEKGVDGNVTESTLN